MPAFSIVNGRSLPCMLKDLHTEMRMDSAQRAEARQRFNEDYERQHQQMIDIITESSELSILLYTQEQNMTFDMAFALKKVTSDYQDFYADRMPYYNIISSLNFEIDRYARLIEALRRLPPMMKEIDAGILPKSLQYHNDSLDLHISNSDSFLEKEIIRIAVSDTFPAYFMLDEEGERYRDSCIYDVSELLKMCADNRATIIADSTNYREAYLRMRETYDYAKARYRELERSVFYKGQTPFMDIIANYHDYWNKTKVDLRGQYSWDELSDTTQPADSAAVQTDTDEDEGNAFYDTLSSKGVNTFLFLTAVVQLVMLVLVWLLTYFVLWLISLFVKSDKFITKNKLPLLSILVGTILYYLVFGIGTIGDEYIQLGVRHINIFLWLLIVISGSLLLRVKPNQIWNGMWLYTPTFLMTLMIIICRVIFIPDRLMTLLFPPLLLLAVLRQLFFCIKESGKATPIDLTLGWVSLAIYLIAFVFAFMGYTFVALLIVMWWYFQLAVLLSTVCIIELLGRYKERWLNRRIVRMRSNITYVTGEDRESLLMGATWFYDLIRQVAIPALVLLSLPLCVKMSLNVFDFNDVYVKIYCDPFVRLTDKNGFETLRISAQSIIHLFILFFVLRYLNRSVHAIWQYLRYAAFMRKHKRTSIRANEINLSLGNSIISVLTWMIFVVAVVVTLRIPLGSLSLVAGGLSAGIGIALKDIINNFIYGIQLMGGRLRVGDWIECDGVRGRVTAINYQCVQAETIDGTEMSFLNSSLFGKNFNNLTRNNSYELIKIVVGVAYGTDVQKVREVLVEAMQKMRTKDKYGREIVEPKYGIHVVVSNMGDSSVEIAVKQYVLVAERIGYIDRAKEVVYNALNAAGISIPFPQCDVHLVRE